MSLSSSATLPYQLIREDAQPFVLLETASRPFVTNPTSERQTRLMSTMAICNTQGGSAPEARAQFHLWFQYESTIRVHCPQGWTIVYVSITEFKGQTNEHNYLQLIDDGGRIISPPSAPKPNTSRSSPPLPSRPVESESAPVIPRRNRARHDRQIKSVPTTVTSSPLPRRWSYNEYAASMIGEWQPYWKRSARTPWQEPTQTDTHVFARSAPLNTFNAQSVSMEFRPPQPLSAPILRQRTIAALRSNTTSGPSGMPVFEANRQRIIDRVSSLTNQGRVDDERQLMFEIQTNRELVEHGISTVVNIALTAPPPPNTLCRLCQLNARTVHCRHCHDLLVCDACRDHVGRCFVCQRDGAIIAPASASPLPLLQLLTPPTINDYLSIPTHNGRCWNCKTEAPLYPNDCNHTVLCRLCMRRNERCPLCAGLPEPN